jgi:hypothetical protein
MGADMDKDLALLILSSCTHTTRQLADLSPMVKTFANPEDYDHLKLAIGSAIHEIQSGIMDYVEARCPEIRADIERRMGRFHRAF